MNDFEPTTPLIGLSTSFHNALESRVFSYLESAYTRAVRNAGGAPRYLPLDLQGEKLNEVLEAVDGVLLLGGDDIDPGLYGQPRHTKTKGIKPQRDSLEIEITRYAIRNRKPLLAICRGIQLVNVALGGTLYQHVLTEMSGASQHDHHKDASRHKKRRDLPAHSVDVVPGTLLASIVKTGTINTNSLHHQGLQVVANSLTISGRCHADGLVEAVELKDHPFFLAVQWHPEEMVNFPEMQRIFQALIAACQKKAVTK